MPGRIPTHSGDPQVSCSPDLGLGARERLLQPGTASPCAVLCHIWPRVLTQPGNPSSGGRRETELQPPLQELGISSPSAEQGGLRHSERRRGAPGAAQHGAARRGMAERTVEKLIYVPSWSRPGEAWKQRCLMTSTLVPLQPTSAVWPLHTARPRTLRGMVAIAAAPATAGVTPLVTAPTLHYWESQTPLAPLHPAAAVGERGDPSDLGLGLQAPLPSTSSGAGCEPCTPM